MNTTLLTTVGIKMLNWCCLRGSVSQASMVLFTAKKFHTNCIFGPKRFIAVTFAQHSENVKCIESRDVQTWSVILWECYLDKMWLTTGFPQVLKSL